MYSNKLMLTLQIKKPIDIYPWIKKSEQGLHYNVMLVMFKA